MVRPGAGRPIAPARRAAVAGTAGLAGLAVWAVAVEPRWLALGGLRAPRGVPAVLGNHDWLNAGEAMGEALAGAGVTVLENGRRALAGGWVDEDGRRMYVSPGVGRAAGRCDWRHSPRCRCCG